FGLSLGIATVLLIAVYVHNELSTDKFHANYENIYRFGATDFNGTATMPGPLTDLVIEKIPDIEFISRIDFSHSWGMELKSLEENLITKDLIFADSTFFKIFTFQSLSGSIENALAAPNSIVITNSLSHQLFGKEDALGKKILLQNKEHLTVSAVIKDVPANSSINFKGVIAIPALKKIQDDDYSKSWGNFNYETFCTLKSDDALSIEAKVNEAFKEVQPERTGTVFSLHPFRDIYFHNPYNDDSLKHGNYQTLLFLVISVFLISILAIINYINLSVANISGRLKSVGIRKISGAHKTHIFQQFFSEAFTIVFTSGLIGLLLAKGFLPELNLLTSPGISSEQLINFRVIALIFISVTVLAAIVSFIPFVITNNQNLQSVLKNQLQLNSQKPKLKYVFIAIQFVITIVLISVSISINKQIHYLATKDLGFDKQDATILLFLDEDPAQNFNLLKNQLTHYPQIKAMSRSHSSPATIGMQWGNELTFQGETKSVTFFTLPVTPGYLEMMGYRIKAGRFFNDSVTTDRGGFILNETAVKEFGIEAAPMEAKISGMGNDAGRIIGVVEDFHFQSLRKPMQPLAFCFLPQWDDMCSLISIKASTENVLGVIEIVRSEFKQLFPEKPFEYYTINDLFADYYKKDNNLNKIIAVFSLLSIVIGCMGLLGIINITIVSKTKEIGIRKVNGARISEVLVMLNKDFIKWVAIAFVIATPVAWYAMNQWLQNFAYKTELSWWIFALSGLLALGIALLTVSWQSWKAAKRNPVEALRNE
ncbi:MAG: ABC transporter permease, partial [Bacteroidales bacterium]|nr:ABC transporter permease [Bacteroidales bacterium]